MLYLTFFIGKNYFSDDEAQNYFIPNPIYDNVKRLTGTETTIRLEHKGNILEHFHLNDNQH